MARQATQLTKKQVRDNGAGRYADGNGLYLTVEDSGARRWIVRVHVRGQLTTSGTPKRRELGLGNTQMVPLEDARRIALDYQRLAKQGIDPSAQGQKTVPTFEEMARITFEQLKPSWTNGKHVNQWITTLEVHVFPNIGN